MTKLMIKLADGDRSAFNPLFASAWPVIRRFTSRSLADGALGEDAAQAALLKVFERASSFRSDGDALTWMLTIAAYECRTIRKAAERRRETGDGEESLSDVPASSVSPERATIAKATDEAVQEIIADLKDVDRETIMTILRDEDRPEMPGATFRKRVQRALARFKESWEAKHDDAD